MEKKDTTVVQSIFTALGSLVGIFVMLAGGVGFIGVVGGLFGLVTLGYSGENSVLFYILALGMTLTWAVMGAWFLKALFGRDYGEIPRIILAFVGIHLMLDIFRVIIIGLSVVSEGISMGTLFGFFHSLLCFVLGGMLLYASRAKQLFLRGFRRFWIMFAVVLIMTVLSFWGSNYIVSK